MFAALKVEPTGTVSDVKFDGVPELVKVEDEDTYAAFVGAVFGELGPDAAAIPVADDVVMIVRLDAAPTELNRTAVDFVAALDMAARTDIAEMVAAVFGADAVSEMQVQSAPTPVYGPVLFVGSLGTGPASLSTRRADQVREIARGVTADGS